MKYIITLTLALLSLTVPAAVQLSTLPPLATSATGTSYPATVVPYALTNTVVVTPGSPIYRIAVTNTTTVAIDYTALDLTNSKVARWETWLVVASTNTTVFLPSTNTVQYLSVPNLATTKTNQTIQIAWQAWKEGTNTLVQANAYARSPADD